MMAKELKKKNNMSFISVASNVGGNVGNKLGGEQSMFKQFQQKMMARKAAEGGGNAVMDGGDGDAGTKLDQIKSIVGGGAEQQAIGPAAQPKKKGGMWGGIGKALGGFSGLFYKMPAAGKYNNSPIEKNYGSPAQRGFHAPNKMKSFGVGESNKEKMGGVGSNLLDK